MRIVLDLQACQTSGSKNRGIGRYSMSLSQAMVRQARGHEIIIALNDRFADTFDAIHRAFDGSVGKENIRAFNAIGPLAELEPANMWRTRAAERIRERYLAELAPDIVHVTSLFEGLGDDAVTSTGNGGGDFETAVTLYDLIPLLNKETYLTNPRVRDWYYRKLMALKQADLLLAISDHSRREAIAALQLTPDHVVNISSAVDPVFRPRVLSIEEAASLRSRYEIHKPFIMYTGGIDYRKNIEGLIEAYAKLPGELRTQYQLAVVCSIGEHDRHRLTSLAGQFGLSPADVIFTGFVPEEDLIALYNACALFVFPSLHEGFGLPVLEAMCCGAAVIGSNTSSIPEVLGREDALFNPRDVSAIAAKMHLALTDDAFRSSLQRHGPQQAKLFSWDASAKRAMDAFEQQYARRQESKRVAVAVEMPRRRLAYLSPLPPEKSGIADYSAELLPELARHYDIDVVVVQNEVTDPWIASNFPVRSVEWFEAHAASYDRIVYHFGNAGFHQHMFGLLERHPGVVVLHDFFMSGALHYADRMGFFPGAFERALYDSHGYAALAFQQKHGREAAMWEYPCNKWVLDRALGIIVHSRFSMHLAKTWYGEDSAADWKLIPHLRALPDGVNRQAARKELGLADDDFLVCSFGLLGPTKLNDRLLDAWLESPLAQDKQCHLVFVGENHGGSYGLELAQKIAASPSRERIKITGFASQELYRTYLAAADAAVQLRTKSRGETSGTVLDCMAYGVPTVINMHGSSADLPAHTLVRLADEFATPELGEALIALRKDAYSRQGLAQRAIDYIRTAHHPAHIGTMYRDAIEAISTESPGARYQRLVRSIAAIAAPVPPSEQDLIAAATSITANQPPKLPRQFLLDVSELVRGDDPAERQRAVRDVSHILLGETLKDDRVEPVCLTDNGLVYARRFTLEMISVPVAGFEDTPVDVKAGDAYLRLHADAGKPGSHPQLITHLRNHGVQVFDVTLDLCRPDGGSHGAQSDVVNWLQSVAGLPKLAYFCRNSDETAEQTQQLVTMRRRAARKYLELNDSDVVVCSICTPGSAQHDEKLLEAWLASPHAKDERCHLVFVGAEGEKLADRVANARCVRLTGHIPQDALRSYLQATDIAVTLDDFTNAPPPTSLLNCLSQGVPAFFIDSTAAMNSFGKALLKLKEQQPEEQAGESTDVEAQATPSRAVEIYREYLEYVAAKRANVNRHTNKARHIAVADNADADARQMLVDVTFLAQHNLNSGIQRVVHHVLLELLMAPPAGYRVEPVYDAGGYYAYARGFTSRVTGRAEPAQKDEPISVHAGDMFLGLDLCPDSVRVNQHIFEDFRNHGIQVFFVVYDLLPVLRPEVFPTGAQANFVDWLDAIVQLADGLVGISRTVADEIAAWVDKEKPARNAPLKLGYFHLGAEMGEIATPEAGGSSAHARPSILMVGTVEPRKGHAQALAAFEKLWAEGADVDLVIVGRQGWMVESLVSKLRTHPENGKHLFWFEGASDESLEKLYQAASALLLASEGEGFGLPLIEAAHHKLPVIARDLPVFREVAGDHALYFSGTAADDLAEALRRWLALYAEGRAPSSEGIQWLTWSESARQLVKAVVEQDWYRTTPEVVTVAADSMPSAA